MAFEKDAGRDVRKMGLLAGLAVLAVTLVFLLFSWLNKPAATASKISLDKAAGGTGQRQQESPAYYALLNKYNDDNARHAAQEGDSYIASVHTDVAPVTVARPVVTPAPPPVATSPPPQQVRIIQTGLDPDRKKAVDALLKQLAVQWQPAGGGLAGVPGATQSSTQPAGAGQPATQSVFAGWTTSLSSSASRNAGNASGGMAQVSDRTLVVAGTRVAAAVDNKVDSDDRRSHVTAHVPAGPFAGATFLSQDVQLAGDGVSIHFTQMAWHGTFYKVDVWAEQQDTLAGNVASSVNHRYFSRIILPAIAHGIGQVGELYEDANTQILSTQYGSVTANVGAPDGSAVAGTIAGGMADKAGQVLEQDAAKLPVEQVIVDRNEPVTLLFMSPLKESDNMQKATGRTSAAQPAPGTPSGTTTPTTPSATPATQADWRRGFPRRADMND